MTILKNTSALLLVCLFATVAHAQAMDAIVIIYAQFPGNDVYELGTGFFVDHDGLIMTADHIIHHVQTSPPSAYISGSAPFQTQPTSIMVYSVALKARFQVDLTQSNNLIGGVLSATEWMDVALLRVTLNEAQRLRVRPLDLSRSPSAPKESVSAYGPSCTNLADSCFQPSVTTTVLSNDLVSSRQYEVRANMTTGYSGGPLVNASGMVVAVDSWGEVIGQNQVTKAFYIPSTYILNSFLDKAPPSSLLNSDDACTKVDSFISLTAFDFQELSQRWIGGNALLQSQDQCTCCCKLLHKAPNAAIRSLALKCSPPFCPLDRLFGLANTITLHLATKAVNADTAASYGDFNSTFNELVARPTWDNARLYTIYNTYGQTLAALSKSDQIRGNVAFVDAPQFALRGLEGSQLLKERSATYMEMGELFAISGDSASAHAATTLGEIVGSAHISAAAREKGVKVDTLRFQVRNSAFMKAEAYQ
jgi:hypothetical protein